jgi:hypothetical protein
MRGRLHAGAERRLLDDHIHYRQRRDFFETIDVLQVYAFRDCAEEGLGYSLISLAIPKPGFQGNLTDTLRCAYAVIDIFIAMRRDGVMP